MSDPAITLIFEYDDAPITAQSLRETAALWLAARRKASERVDPASSSPHPERSLFSASDAVGAARRGSKGT